MNGTAENKTLSLEWLRANLRLVLLGLNALVLVALCVVLISQAVFEMNIRALLKKATSIEQQAKQDQSEKGSRSREGGSSSSDRAGRRSSGRGGEGDRTPGVSEEMAFLTEAMTGPTVTSATKATSATTVSGDQTSSAVRVTTTSLETTASSAAATASIVAGDRIGSATPPTSTPISTSVSLLVSTAAATSAPAASTATAVAASGASSSSGTAVSDGVSEHASQAGERDSGRRDGEMSSGRFSSRGGDSRGSMSGPEDEKKREMFAKLERRGLFGEPRPMAMRPQLEAVLGGSAQISGQWVTVGQRWNESKVVEIGTDRVVLEDSDGKRHDVVMMFGEGGPGRMMGEMGRFSGTSGTAMARSDGMGPVNVERPGVGGPGMSFNIPDSILDRLTGPGGRYQGMSREQVMDQFRRMREGRGEGGGGRGGDRGGRGGDRGDRGGDRGDRAGDRR